MHCIDFYQSVQKLYNFNCFMVLFFSFFVFLRYAQCPKKNRKFSFCVKKVYTESLLCIFLFFNVQVHAKIVSPRLGVELGWPGLDCL